VPSKRREQNVPWHLLLSLNSWHFDAQLRAFWGSKKREWYCGGTPNWISGKEGEE
jgi:hypothetical protein